MAIRPYFVCDNKKIFVEKQCEFKFYPGFAVSQKIKSIESFHNEIKQILPNANILEVSTKSPNPIGYRLSAFNLKYTFNNGNSYCLENVFQSSKVFENNKKFNDLLFCTAKEAKTDVRIKNSGKLTCFMLNGIKWELEPKTAFYDYTYITALMNDAKLCDELLNYNVFTDIEFNPKRSFNCQARSVAIFISLSKQNKLNEYLKDKESFVKLYEHSETIEQMTLALFQDKKGE